MKKLLSLFLGLILLMSPLNMTTVEAETNSWDFNTSGNYIVSDSYDIEISGGVAKLIPRLTPKAEGHLLHYEGTTLLSEPRGIAVSGNYAYVVDNNLDGVEVIDISSTSMPSHAGKISDNTDRALNEPDDIAISGNYAYVTGLEGLEVLDISDPTNPSHVAALIDTGTFELNGSRGIQISGNYAYIAAFSDDGFAVVDISDPTAPIQVGSVEDDATTLLYQPTDVVIDGNYAYISSYGENGIEIIDISNPANPVHAGKFQDDATTLMRGLSSIAKRGNYIYVTSVTDDAFTTLDATDPVNLVHADNIIDSGSSRHELYGAYDIAFYGDYALVASNFDKGVEVVDISDPTDLKHESSVDETTMDMNFNFPQNICVAGNYAFVTSKGAMQVMDLDNVVYPINKPYVYPNLSLSYSSSVLSFSEKHGSGSQGSITYQISKNNGGKWYYLDNGVWTLATTDDGSQTSSAAEINENIHTLCSGAVGSFTFRAFLESNGRQAVELDEISVEHDVVPELRVESIKRFPGSPFTPVSTYMHANAQGDVFMKITDSSVAPADFDDAIPVMIIHEPGVQNFMLPDIPEGEQYLHFVLKVGGVLSEVKTIHLPYDFYYSEDFEVFDTSLPGVTYPPSFSPLMTGTGPLEQKVINDNGNNVFRLLADDTTDSVHGMATTAVSSGTLVFSMDVKPVSGDWPAAIYVSSDDSPFGPEFAIIGLNNGILTTEGNVGPSVIPDVTYSLGEWYNLSVMFDDDNKEYAIAFDGELVGSGPIPYGADVTTGAFSIVCGNSGDNEAYFDNVKIYQLTSEMSVSYDANGAAAGSVPTDSNVYRYMDEVTVLGNTGTLVRQGYSFDGWNTLADGSGTHYNAGGTFRIKGNTTLYAEWSMDEYEVRYYANSATSGTVPTDSNAYKLNDTVTVKDNTGNLVRSGYTFTGWNTKADGNGTHYDPADTFSAVGHTSLYAEWDADNSSVAPTPTPTPVVTSPTPTPVSTPITTPPEIAVSDIEVDSDTIQIELGSTELIGYEVLPENATDKSVTWASLDDGIASVDNGVVTANGLGITIITVSADDSNGTVSKTITVEVIETTPEDDDQDEEEAVIATPTPDDENQPAIEPTEDITTETDTGSNNWIFIIIGFIVIVIGIVLGLRGRGQS